MLDAEQEALFAAPREAFVTERTRIARELKKAGRPQEAAEIAKLPKPTLAAWVVNQLARQRRPLVKQLGAAGQRLREVQLGMMAGRGPEGGGEGDARAAFAQATAAQREALSKLRAAAQELLAEADSGAPVHLLEAVLRTLRSGAASDIAQATLEQGRLLREIDAQDLGALAAAIPAFAGLGAGDGGTVQGEAHKAAVGPRAVAAAEAKAKTGAPAHAARPSAPEAQAEREAERARQAAERAAERARAEARAVAQREVDHVRRAFEKVDKERARLDDEVARAREGLAEAERRAATAREGADTAAARLAAAERRLRELPA
jgi:hypothetical protein